MAADTQLLGKRKKKIPKNPNPLFIKWLTQWKHEAAEKGISLQYTYNKVNNSHCKAKGVFMEIGIHFHCLNFIILQKKMIVNKL